MNYANGEVKVKMTYNDVCSTLLRVTPSASFSGKPIATFSRVIFNYSDAIDLTLFKNTASVPLSIQAISTGMRNSKPATSPSK